MAQNGRETLPEIEECQTLLLDNAAPQDVQETDISEACGMVLAETVYADMPVPPYPKSAMDGYAVCAADLEGATKENPVKLRVKGQLFAGDYDEIPYEKGTAVRIMTGAFVPEGYDAVVRQEDTDYGESVVSVCVTAKPFSNYCKVGEDIQKGDVVVRQGTRLSPVHIGLLAGIGREKILVYRPVRVAILCTGTELAELGQPLAKGKIYNNIAYILAAGIRREGLQVVCVRNCADEEQFLTEQLNEALEISDLVITTGGVSVGKKDIVPDVLRNIQAQILFRRANIQPGTPTTASVKDGKIILSLSGNPYAALVNFEIYFWHLAAKMMHHESFDTVKGTAVLQSEYPKVNRVRRQLRARAEDGKVYLPTEIHASSVIHNLTECNCFIDLEPGRQVQVGDSVRIRYIKGM
jgi:molybdopterin molybdotransferase